MFVGAIANCVRHGHDKFRCRSARGRRATETKPWRILIGNGVGLVVPDRRPGGGVRRVFHRGGVALLARRPKRSVTTEGRHNGKQTTDTGSAGTRGTGSAGHGSGSSRPGASGRSTTAGASDRGTTNADTNADTTTNAARIARGGGGPEGGRRSGSWPGWGAMRASGRSDRSGHTGAPEAGASGRGRGPCVHRSHAWPPTVPPGPAS
jgi:hypothetical protein